MYYWTFNPYADLRNGNRGFMNTRQIGRCATKDERAKLIDLRENQNARAVTRKEAEEIFRGNYTSIGAKVPRGGLFGDEENFWAPLF